MPASSSPRVADFSTHLSGPLTSHYLAEMGADVVKIEHWAIGDGNRGVDPLINEVGMIHVNCGPGVRSLAADLRSPHSAEVVRACARWADVVIVGARPRDAAARGLDFDSVKALNPSVVYCAVSGYGTTGPWRDRPAHGLQLDAYAGHVPIEWVEGQPRVRDGFRTAGTTAAAMFAAMGIWAALYRSRQTPGRPAQNVHVSAWDAAMSWQWRDLTTAANLGHMWTEYAEAGTRYAMYATADRRALLLCPLERRFWEALSDLVELPAEVRARGDWSINGMDWGVGPQYEDERGLLERRIGAQPLEYWTERLVPTGVPFAPILTPAEALASDHAGASGVLGRTTVGGHEAWYTRSAVRFLHPTGEPAELGPPPVIGEHTDEVLRDIGLDHLVGHFPHERP